MNSHHIKCKFFILEPDANSTFWQKKDARKFQFVQEKAKAVIKGYDLSDASRDNCQQGQYGPHSIELQISHSCNTDTQKKHGKGDLDGPAAVKSENV